MHKLDRRIEIVSSTLPGLSSMGPTSRQGILSVLSKRYTDVKISIVNTRDDLEKLVARRPDLVFLGMKFLPVHPAKGQHDTEKIWIAEALTAHNIAYTGSGHTAHTYERDKGLAKQRVQDNGLSTAPFYVSERTASDSHNRPNLSFPLFVKPTDRGGGEGIDVHSVVYTKKQLEKRITFVHAQLKTSALVEEYLTGREFSVALLRSQDNEDLHVMPLELIAPVDHRGHRVLSARIKSADTERAVEIFDTEIKQRISALAVDVFDCLGARDYGRIDIRFDRQGTPRFMEANLLPSLLDEYGNFPKACMLNMKMGYETMILHIVGLAFEREMLPVEQPKTWSPDYIMTPLQLASI